METTETNIVKEDKAAALQRAWSVLASVTDPEVPVLSIVDLGVVRDVILDTDGEELVIKVVLTPTYTGCPAMDVMKINTRMALLAAGFKHILLHEVLSPAWNTAWMSDAGKEKLKAYGIAPPQYHAVTIDAFAAEERVSCPLCNASNTRLVSQFGSTACKALYQCNQCGEPFDYFKCH